MTVPTPERTSTYFLHFPQWFVAIFAMVYISGYLIDSLYYSYLGIAGSGGEILKLKYIQTGVTFVIFLLILSGPSLFNLLAFAFSCIDPARQVETIRSRFADAFPAAMTICYLLSIYSLLIFTPPLYFKAPYRLEDAIAFIFIVQIVYLIMIAYYERGKAQLGAAGKPDDLGPTRPVRKSSHSTVVIWHAICSLDRYDWARIAVSLVLLVLTAVIDIFVFSGMKSTIKSALYDRHGFIFFLFCLAIGVLVYRGIDRFRSPPVRGAAAYRISMLASVIVLFYMAVASYAYLIFPFIPNTKGGADFTAVPRFTVLTKGAVQPETGMILLYASSTSLFFAKPLPGNNACMWRLGDAFPVVKHVPLSMIQFTESAPVVGTSNNCDP